MSTRWAAYRARWKGEEYLAFPHVDQDGDYVRIHSATGGPGFAPTESGGYVRPVPLGACDVVLFVTMVCSWRTIECQVLDERDEDLLLQFVGGSTPQARSAGFDRIERGVYRRWVGREEIRGLRENTTVLYAGD